MRARAQDLVTQELGPRTDLDIHRAVERQVEAEGWTQLDRQLVRDQREPGVIDMARDADGGPDAFLPMKVGRRRKLEALCLADEIGPGQWVIDEKAEATLRALRISGSGTACCTRRSSWPLAIVSRTIGPSFRCRCLHSST